MLFNEPKLLKYDGDERGRVTLPRFSALQRAEIAEIKPKRLTHPNGGSFSALQRAEIAEMARSRIARQSLRVVSVLFNEPKLLKSGYPNNAPAVEHIVSVLFNEPKLLKCVTNAPRRYWNCVSVLFNEPKLLKYADLARRDARRRGFSALQRAEIAEMRMLQRASRSLNKFQCSSTSRNC